MATVSVRSGRTRVLARSGVPSHTVSGLTLLALTIAAALLVLGCDQTPTAPGMALQLNVQSVVKTTLSNKTGPHIRRVVRDHAEFDALWTELWGDREPAHPPIDFAQDMVVVASGPGVCFGDVTIEGAKLEDGSLEVQLAEADGSTLLCLCAFPQYTFHVASMRRFDGPERFSVRGVPAHCG